MSNSTAILAALNATAFDCVRDQIRADMLAWAVRMLASYQKQVAEWKASEALPVHCRQMADYKTFPKCRINGSWIGSKVDCSNHGCMGNDYYRKLQNAVAGWTINEANVQKDADARWEDDKAFYAARVGEKADLIGGDGEIRLMILRDSTLVGTCEVTLGDKRLILETSLKTNYRYGENSANGHLTIYRQVPTFCAAAYGFDFGACEAAKLAAEVNAKADKKVNLKALAEAVKVAEKRKRKWEDLYATLRFASQRPEGLINGNLDSARQDAAGLGLAGIPSLDAAKLAYKSAQAAHKDAKLALKAAK